MTGETVHGGHRERLRARYAAVGEAGLADHELLELLLTYCIPRRDTNPLAHSLLERFGSLSGVLSADLRELCSVPGVGQSTAVFLCLQRDMMKRIRLEDIGGGRGKLRLQTPLLSAKYALAMLERKPHETVLAVCLNAKREVLSHKVMQEGSLTEAQVYPRSIAELALLSHAHSILLIHNHPSGSPLPSPADAETTKAVRDALQGIGIQLTDHLIVGNGVVYSFAADVLIELTGREPATLTIPEWNAYKPAEGVSLKKVMEEY